MIELFFNKGFFIFLCIMVLAFYVYTSFAYMSIGRKAHLNGNIAWIPMIGPALIASKMAKMSWTPILLLIGSFIPIIQIFTASIFQIYFIIWNWKAFESLGKPGWWNLLMLVPVVGWFIYFILLGIVAWRD